MRILAVLLSLAAATAAADDTSPAGSPVLPSAPFGSEDPPVTRRDFRPGSRLEIAPSSKSEIDPATLLEWYRERFEWDPARSSSPLYVPVEGCLPHLTERKCVRPPRGGVYRYLRRKATHYFKREYRRQLKREMEINPSFSFDDLDAGHEAWRQATLEQSLRGRVLRLQSIGGGRETEEAAPEPYIARVGPFRIDDTYRLELDLHDLWSAEKPEYDPVPGAAAPARSLRKRPSERWLNLKVSTSFGVRVGQGMDAADVIRNYAAKVTAEFLPGRKGGPLFSSQVRVKMTFDGEARITFNIFEKRF